MYRTTSTPEPCRHKWVACATHFTFEVALNVRCAKCGESPKPGSWAEIWTLVKFRLGI